MTINLLVAGGARVDAGKTTFSAGLIDHIDGTGFKPRAGNDYWFDHDDYRFAIGQGRLYGKDARRLAAASTIDTTPEDLNPVHRLWRPAPGPKKGILDREERAFVVDRISTEETGEESAKEATYVVNGTIELPKSVRTQLPLASAIEIDSLHEFNDVMARAHLRRRTVREDLRSIGRERP